MRTIKCRIKVINNQIQMADNKILFKFYCQLKIKTVLLRHYL
jgi:hypothetical protein